MNNNYPYVSKEERKIQIEDPTGKWSDLTLLPEWEEKYYDVYTARKHGKWVMLKSLKKEYADDPKYRKMLEREFDTRYNLAHPNIVMVNDFEDVPGVGMSIITDDVYGYSLRRMIDEKRLTPKILYRLQTQLLDALYYIQENHIVHHHLTPESIIFTEYNENLKLINVGYDHADKLTPQDTAKDIIAYGKILNEVLDNISESKPRLRHIANRCEDPNRGYRSITDLQLVMEKRSAAQIYIFLTAFILVMAALLVWLIVR